MDAADVIKRINDADMRLALMAGKMEDYAWTVQVARTALKEAVEKIREQDVTIRAMTGEYGDACNSDGCGG